MKDNDLVTLKIHYELSLIPQLTEICAVHFLFISAARRAKISLLNVPLLVFGK